jgi:hypothetical protein
VDAAVERCVSIRALTALVGVKARMARISNAASMPVKALVKQLLSEYRIPVTIALKI